MQMKIAIFIQQAVYNRLYGGEGQLTGIGWFIVHLVRSLAEIDRANHYTLFYVSRDCLHEQAQKLLHLEEASNFSLFQIPLPGPSIYGLWHVLGRPRVESFIGQVDVLHLPTVAVRVPTHLKRVITIPDLTYLHFPEAYSVRMRMFVDKALRDALESGASLVAISEYVASDLVKFGFAREQISTVYPGGNTGFDLSTQLEPEHVLAKWDVSEPYILFVGALTPRKNIPNLVRAYAKMPEAVRNRYRLLLVGPKADDTEHVMQTIEKVGIQPRVTIAGFVDEVDLGALHRGATAFVMPSLSEGFGIPVVDSMAAGVPVIVSSAGSLPEVAGDAGVYCNPYDVRSISDALARVLLDNGLRCEMIEKGRVQAQKFSWTKAAEQMLQVYSKVVEQPQ